MDESTADGLRGAGALLAAASLALPWYSLHAAATTASLGTDANLMHVSGWRALGGLRWLVLALALGAGLRLHRRAFAALPGVAGVGLLMVIGLRWTAPPSASGLMADELPRTSGLSSAIANSVLDSFSRQLGLELRPAAGLAVAAAGAAGVLVGVLARPVSAPRATLARHHA
jgi:hypothetical protein